MCSNWLTARLIFVVCFILCAYNSQKVVVTKLARELVSTTRHPLPILSRLAPKGTTCA